MVSSLDGRAATEEGAAAGLGGPADRELMRLLRASADAVATGAGTLRAEKVNLSIPDHFARPRPARGQRIRPLAIVLTASGSDLPLRENLVYTPSEDLIILTTPEVDPGAMDPPAEARLVTIPESPESSPRKGLDLQAALRMLRREHGVASLLLEGGPGLNHAFVGARLADELFLTLAPKLLGGLRPATILHGPALPSESPGLSLLSAHISAADELFLRYAIRYSARF